MDSKPRLRSERRVLRTEPGSARRPSAALRMQTLGGGVPRADPVTARDPAAVTQSAPHEREPTPGKRARTPRPTPRHHRSRRAPPSAGTQSPEDGPGSLGLAAPKLEIKSQGSPAGAAAYLLPGPAARRDTYPGLGPGPAALLAQSQRRSLDPSGAQAGPRGARGRTGRPVRGRGGPGRGKSARRGGHGKPVLSVRGARASRAAGGVLEGSRCRLRPGRQQPCSLGPWRIATGSTERPLGARSREHPVGAVSLSLQALELETVPLPG